MNTEIYRLGEEHSLCLWERRLSFGKLFQRTPQKCCQIETLDDVFFNVLSLRMFFHKIRSLATTPPPQIFVSLISIFVTKGVPNNSCYPAFKFHDV